MKDLKKKLEIAQPVVMSGFNYSRTIRELYDANLITLLKMEWMGRFDQEYKSKDLKEDDDWSTYDRCAGVVLYSDKVEVDIFEGEMLMGYRTKKRWSATFSPLPESELIRFQSSIEWRFKSYCQDIYEEEIAAAENKRVEAIGKELLKIKK